MDEFEIVDYDMFENFCGIVEVGEMGIDVYEMMDYFLWGNVIGSIEGEIKGDWVFVNLIRFEILLGVEK